MVKLFEEEFFEDNTVSEEELLTIRRGLSELDKKFQKNIDVFKKILGDVEDSELNKKLEDLISKADLIERTRKKLKKKGKSITSLEAKNYIEISKEFDEIRETNSNIQYLLEKQVNDLSELDLSKPLELASKNLGKDAAKFFINNAETISRSEITGEAGTAALRALSPEVSFFSEVLGINPQQKISDFLASQKDKLDNQNDDELAVFELNDIARKLLREDKTTNELVDDLVEETKFSNKSNELVLLENKQILEDILKESKNANRYDNEVVEETMQEDTQKLDEISEKIEEGLFNDIIATKEFKDLENQLAKERIVQANDHHEEDIKYFDDIFDILLRIKGSADRFLEKEKLGFFGKLFTPFVALGSAILAVLTSSKFREVLKFLGVKGLEAGKKLGTKGIGTAYGGAVGIGSLFSAQGRIREDGGLSTSTALQSIGSGALVGGLLGGPLGALIGGGVAAFISLLNNLITDEQLSKLKNAFDSATDSIFDAFKLFGKIFITPVIKFSSELLKAFLNPIDTIEKASDFVGEKIDKSVAYIIEKAIEIKDKIQEKISEAIDFIKSGIDFIFEKIKELFDVLSSTKEKIKDFFIPKDSAERQIIGGDLGPTSLSGYLVEGIKGLFSDDNKDKPIVVNLPQSNAKLGINDISESTNELETSLSQLRVGNAIAEKQDKNYQQLVKNITNTVRDKKSGIEKKIKGGLRSLNNAPIHSNDIGLIMVLGGGA